MFKLRKTRLILFVCVIFLCGCPPEMSNILHKRAGYKKADAKFSASIFLNSAANNKHIFIQIRNSACPQFTEKMKKHITSELKQKNLQIVSDPIAAEFLLQANIVQCEQSNRTGVQHAIDKGYGSPIDHSVKEINQPIKDFVVDENIILSIIADLQISERIANTTSTESKLDLADKKHVVKSWKQYQTRLAITKKPIIKHDFNSSAIWLIEELARAITRVFAQ